MLNGEKDKKNKKVVPKDEDFRILMHQSPLSIPQRVSFEI